MFLIHIHHNSQVHLNEQDLGWKHSSVEEHLTSMCKALGLTPSASKQNILRMS